MREEKLKFGIIFRIAISLLPILFGMPAIAMIWCAFNIAMTFVIFGPRNSIVGSIAAIGVSMLFFESFGSGAMIEGLFLGLEIVLCAAGCIYALATRSSFYVGVWLSSAGFLIPSVMSLKTSADHSGVSIAQLITDEPMLFLKAQLEALLSQSGISDFSQIDSLISSVREMMMTIVPSVLLISAVVIGYIVMWCVCAQLRRVSKGNIHSFSEIKIPKTMVIIMLVALGLYLINLPQEAEFVLLNIVVVFGAFCFFAGISFLDFYLRRIVKNTILRVVVHFIIFMCASALTSISPFFNIAIVYAFIAMIDSFVNIRKIGQKKPE